MKQKLINLFTNSKDITRDSYLWNTLSATVFATQSAIVLIVITRTNGLEDAGVFSIAYAVASLMFYIGDYGVRKYQVSDVNEVLSWPDYHSHRVVSCTVMLITSIVVILLGIRNSGYSSYKAYVIFMVCLLKVIEAYSEVYFGRFQQVGRLDVAAKTNAFRTIAAMAACMICLVVTHNMAVAMTVWVVVALITFIASTIIVAPLYGKLDRSFNWSAIIRIFRECLPLFAGYFLLLYVGNAPKYAIDACMSEVDQACYNFIFMPVFAIGLFANFVFNPILVKMSTRWDLHEYKGFKKMILRQIAVITAITLLAIAVALTIGCPVLGWLYNADLKEYKIDLVILMVGGGMLALVNFFTVVVTVMREQKFLLIGYLIAALAAWILANRVVAKFGIRGATIMYTVLMAITAIAFASVMIFYIRKGEKTYKTNN